MEDPEKVKKTKDSLNKGKDGPWDDVIGFHNLASVDIEHKVLNLDSGINVKCFYNAETDEIKVYFFKKFLKD